MRKRAHTTRTRTRTQTRTRAKKRRDAGRPRGEPVQQTVLACALDEIARAGVEGMSVDRIAKAAEVNKTSIYRRWPTREALAAAAFAQLHVDVELRLPDTGSLRGDLESTIALIAATLTTSPGRALARAAFATDAPAATHFAAEVRELLATQRRRTRRAVNPIVVRAMKRGEWRTPTSAAFVDVVFSTLLGAVTQRVLVEKRAASPRWGRALAELIARAVA